VTGAQIADFRVRDDEGARVSGVSAGSGRSNDPVQRHAARPTTSSMSSTVESFSGPRVAVVVAPPRKKYFLYLIFSRKKSIIGILFFFFSFQILKFYLVRLLCKNSCNLDCYAIWGFFNFHGL
jgi:hypothetical protein